MKLHKALKLRKKLVGEIANLKKQIQAKNSYMVGSLNPDKYNVPQLYKELMKKIDKLNNLKLAINEANREIQLKIYALAEWKSLISFWNDVSVDEGSKVHGFSETRIMEYKAQIDEEQRNVYIRDFQVNVDALQEEIDAYNHTTDVLWDETEETQK